MFCCQLRIFDHIVRSYSRTSRFANHLAHHRFSGKPTRGDLRMRIARMASALVDTPQSEDFAKKLTLSDEVQNNFVTEHLYYTDTELCTCQGKVIGVRLIEFQGESRKAIILDQTVMHPQGGKDISVKC